MKTDCKLSLTLLLVTVSILLSCSGGEKQTADSLVTNEEGEILAPEERTWDKDLLRQELSLHSDLNDSLLQASSIEGLGNNIYVSDLGDMRLKRFHLDGRYRDSFGKKGRGPGEFQLPVDYDLANSSDTLFVIDARKMRLMLFDTRTTDFITSHEVTSNPYRLAVVDGKLMIERSTAEKLFTTSAFRDVRE